MLTETYTVQEKQVKLNDRPGFFNIFAFAPDRSRVPAINPVGGFGIELPVRTVTQKQVSILLRLLAPLGIQFSLICSRLDNPLKLIQDFKVVLERSRTTRALSISFRRNPVTITRFKTFFPCDSSIAFSSRTSNRDS